MYAWLEGALDAPGCVLTSSRRLARILTEHFGQQQIERGRAVWQTPEIYFWRDWLRIALTEVGDSVDLPVRISAAQSRVVLERCLSRTVQDPLLNRGALLRQVQDSWTRLHDWNVSVDACEKNARSRDHFMFVRVARCYEELLTVGNWLDPAGLPGLCAQLIREHRMAVPRRVCVAGFDRLVPVVSELLDAIRATGSTVDVVEVQGEPHLDGLHAYESTEAEIRAAGQWARRQLEANSSARLAIVVPDLEQFAKATGRLVQEGLVPGWQNGGDLVRRAANVSFGQSLLAYPGINIASLLLRWLHSDLSTADISILLCSSLLGAGTMDGRSRLDLELRQRPGQNWTPEALSAVLARSADDPELTPWFAALRQLAKMRSAMPGYASPAEWAALFDEMLDDFGWPGAVSLSSEAFQLVNRWRELLNEFSQLSLVEDRLDARDAHRRLDTLAAESLFQPEATEARVQVLGPLEAAGLEFDGLWVARMTAANWPPAGRPLSLVSRDLQREMGMPDADPDDTLEYGRRVLERLLASARTVIVSHARHVEDAEQTLTGLVGRIGGRIVPGPPDPGWNARQLLDRVSTASAGRDRVPAVTAGERVEGGAGTLQLQLTDPFSAFVRGRLGVRGLTPLKPGLSAQLRGNLIHDTLRFLYAELPASGEIGDWQGSQLDERVRYALARAFGPCSRHADPLLKKLLQFEESRTAPLVRDVVALDQGREEFAVESVEAPVDAVIEGVRLRLRVDRIDRLPGGELLVWDYKTGRTRKILGRNGDPTDYQLVVYSLALATRIAGIGLYNIDSRVVGMEAASALTMTGPEWDDALGRWQMHIKNAAREFAAGDVRVNRAQSAAAARAYALLSRYQEVEDVA